MKRSLIISLMLVCSLSLTSMALINAAGIIGGTVKDPKGAVIVGAQISLRNATTGESRNATTDGEGRFKTMMRDFVKTHFNQNAPTESFKRVLERHMKPVMDLDRNRKMDWFFNQWVFGTEVPRYRLDYTLTPEPDGKVLLSATLKQSDVSDRFMGLVGIYVEVDAKTVRLGLGAVQGTTPTEFKVRLPKKPKRVLLNFYGDVLATESTSGER